MPVGIRNTRLAASAWACASVPRRLVRAGLCADRNPYARHNAWLGDGHVLRDAHKLADIPGVLINGRFDFQAPLTTAWELHRRWPHSELIVVDNAGHAANHRGITQELIRATDRFSNS